MEVPFSRLSDDTRKDFQVAAGPALVQLLGIALFILLHEFPELEEVGVQGIDELPKNNEEVAMNCLRERFASVQVLLEKL